MMTRPMRRRIISIPVNKVPDEIENMLSRSDGINWTGKLKDELPGIWNYFNTIPEEDRNLIDKDL